MEKHFDVAHVVSASTNHSASCELCINSFEGLPLSHLINHYIENHDYKILHIGTVTEQNTDNGEVKLWHSTLALLGK